MDRTVNFGLILFGLGVVILVGYWMWHVVIVSNISLGIKIAMISMVIGIGVILLSVIRERVKEASSEDVGRKQQ